MSTPADVTTPLRPTPTQIPPNSLPLNSPIAATEAPTHPFPPVLYYPLPTTTLPPFSAPPHTSAFSPFPLSMPQGFYPQGNFVPDARWLYPMMSSASSSLLPAQEPEKLVSQNASHSRSVALESFILDYLHRNGLEKAHALCTESFHTEEKNRQPSSVEKPLGPSHSAKGSRELDTESLAVSPRKGKKKAVQITDDDKENQKSGITSKEETLKSFGLSSAAVSGKREIQPENDLSTAMEVAPQLLGTHKTKKSRDSERMKDKKKPQKQKDEIPQVSGHASHTTKTMKSHSPKSAKATDAETKAKPKDMEVKSKHSELSPSEEDSIPFVQWEKAQNLQATWKVLHKKDDVRASEDNIISNVEATSNSTGWNCLLPADVSASAEEVKKKKSKNKERQENALRPRTDIIILQEQETASKNVKNSVIDKFFSPSKKPQIAAQPSYAESPVERKSSKEKSKSTKRDRKQGNLETSASKLLLDASPVVLPSKHTKKSRIKTGVTLPDPVGLNSTPSTNEKLPATREKVETRNISPRKALRLGTKQITEAVQRKFQESTKRAGRSSSTPEGTRPDRLSNTKTQPTSGAPQGFYLAGESDGTDSSECTSDSDLSSDGSLLFQSHHVQKIKK